MMDYIVRKDMFRFVLVILIMTLSVTTGALILSSFDNAPSDSIFYPIETALSISYSLLFQFRPMDEEITEATERVALTITYYIFTFLINILIMNLLIAAYELHVRRLWEICTLCCVGRYSSWTYWFWKAILPLPLQGKGSIYKKRVVTSWGRNGDRKDRKLYLFNVVNN